MKRAKELKRGLIVDDEHVISFFYCLVRADSEKCDKHETNWAENSARPDYLVITKHSFFWAKESSRLIGNNELHMIGQSLIKKMFRARRRSTGRRSTSWSGRTSSSKPNWRGLYHRRNRSGYKRLDTTQPTIQQLKAQIRCRVFKR